MQEKNVLTLSSGSLQKFANSFLRSYHHGCVKKTRRRFTMSAYFCLALTTAVVKSLFTNLQDEPPGTVLW